MPPNQLPAGTREACGHAWCITAHGATSHPDDEDHRSAGILVHGVGRVDGHERDVALEVGLLRRHNGDDEWFVVEDGDGVHFEVTVRTARHIARAIAADPALRAHLLG